MNFTQNVKTVYSPLSGFLPGEEKERGLRPTAETAAGQADREYQERQSMPGASFAWNCG